MAWNVGAEYEDPFRQACSTLGTDADQFVRFRQDRMVRTIVDNCPAWKGRQFLQATKLFWPLWLTEHHEELLAIDAIGEPINESDLPYTPALCRFIFRALELTGFGDRGDWLHDQVVVEIGGGWGCLAALICRFFSPRAYYVIDLPEALLLQRRFLEAAGAGAVRLCERPGEVPEVETVISDCTLSELDNEGRTKYGQGILARSRRGAFVWSGKTSNPGALDDWVKTDDVGKWLGSVLSPSHRITNSYRTDSMSPFWKQVQRYPTEGTHYFAEGSYRWWYELPE